MSVLDGLNDPGGFGLAARSGQMQGILASLQHGFGNAMHIGDQANQQFQHNQSLAAHDVDRQQHADEFDISSDQRQQQIDKKGSIVGNKGGENKEWEHQFKQAQLDALKDYRAKQLDLAGKKQSDLVAYQTHLLDLKNTGQITDTEYKKALLGLRSDTLNEVVRHHGITEEQTDTAQSNLEEYRKSLIEAKKAGQISEDQFRQGMLKYHNDSLAAINKNNDTKNTETNRHNTATETQNTTNETGRMNRFTAHEAQNKSLSNEKSAQQRAEFDARQKQQQDQFNTSDQRKGIGQLIQSAGQAQNDKHHAEDRADRLSKEPKAPKPIDIEAEAEMHSDNDANRFAAAQVIKPTDPQVIAYKEQRKEVWKRVLQGRQGISGAVQHGSYYEDLMDQVKP